MDLTFSAFSSRNPCFMGSVQLYWYFYTIHYAWIKLPHVSVDLDDIIPFLDWPHAILLHVGRWALPVPCLNRNIPFWAVVCSHVVQSLTGDSDLQLQQLCPAQAEAGEDVPERDTLDDDTVDSEGTPTRDLITHSYQQRYDVYDDALCTVARYYICTVYL